MFLVFVLVVDLSCLVLTPVFSFFYLLFLFSLFFLILHHFFLLLVLVYTPVFLFSLLLFLIFLHLSCSYSSCLYSYFSCSYSSFPVFAPLALNFTPWSFFCSRSSINSSCSLCKQKLVLVPTPLILVLGTLVIALIL